MAAAALAIGCSSDPNNASGPGGAGGSGGSSATGGTSGASGGTGGAGNADSSTDCALRTDIDSYVANMSKKGSNSLMSFQLIQSDPAPPIFGNNVWKLKVTGNDGMPVTKGLAVEVFMPDHGHPSPIPPTITYDATTGVYTLNPIYFSMVGTWRITFKITDPNDPTIVIDQSPFFFCVA